MWDECDWYGFVECDNGFVTRFIICKYHTMNHDISVREGGLVIPRPALLALMFILMHTILNSVTNQNGVGKGVNGNGLHGTLPEEFGYLTSLKQLTIDRNPMLTSNIPATFSKLTNLRRLSLLFNNLQEPWSEGLLDNMTELSGLYLNYNDFNMTLPVDISNCTSLTGLGLAGNKLYGSIPSEYGKLYSLSKH
jgi:hypothetical protein